MGVKDLWPFLEPHAERKPITELRGKIVAIDLAGWVCESLNVVDYFVHSKHHLKNIFFRTSFLIFEEVIPVFVLEGTAPKLKAQIIAKRNELQFRGTKPREKQSAKNNNAHEKGRTRFNHVLKQCADLLQCMGIKCVQAPGEGEAYCAILNKHGLVDGVISQDSDCFAYGAVCVYRNFSISMQGAQAANGGALDIYDMRKICKKIDFGQNKIIVMALLSGCDYCPDGVGGVGRESVLKLFNKYKETEILNRLRAWRNEDHKYTALELRVNDKNICNNCGHMGRTQRHTTHGCAVCRTVHGCDATLWREQRLSIKAELALRQKALSLPDFPNEEIIAEFLTEIKTTNDLQFNWSRPNLIKFIKQFSKLLQWKEIYCFEKFLPILTRWHLINYELLKNSLELIVLKPIKIHKKRVLKSIPSLEIEWQDVQNCMQGLIPEDQLEAYIAENIGKSSTSLWTTIEPLNMFESVYPDMVETFIKSKEKPKPQKKRTNIKATEQMPEKNTRKPKTKSQQKKCGLMEKFLIKQTGSTPLKTPKHININCLETTSTPNMKSLPFNINLFEDVAEENTSAFNMSAIVQSIVQSTPPGQLGEIAGHALYYEPLAKDINRQILKDDLDLLVAQKRLYNINSNKKSQVNKKCKLQESLDDSFDVLVNAKNYRLQELITRSKEISFKPNNCSKTDNYVESILTDSLKSMEI